MLRTFVILLAFAGCTDAPSDPPAKGPIDDCVQSADGSTLSCPRSYPGCTLQADRSVQFERCGHRNEYVVYGRVDGCPMIYDYAEGSFLSPEDWEAFVGACGGRKPGDM